jgi:hypothetical protein
MWWRGGGRYVFEAYSRMPTVSHTACNAGINKNGKLVEILKALAMAYFGHYFYICKEELKKSRPVSFTEPRFSNR